MSKTRRIKIENIEGKVKNINGSVVLELNAKNAKLELHFNDPNQLMMFCFLVIEQMAEAFPEYEYSKLWKDENFY